MEFLHAQSLMVLVKAVFFSSMAAHSSESIIHYSQMASLKCCERGRCTRLIMRYKKNTQRQVTIEAKCVNVINMQPPDLPNKYVLARLTPQLHVPSKMQIHIKKQIPRQL
ncbi:hypothetical protein HBH82_215910 [Parastagonospora nodorum]|nr:hypothetical protein HBH82_215910 [Parastagonospora nodorum]KAH4665532.1 hypothetical protein HBH78_202240 [Parastagonospora nodorum]KAH4694634.1 hypothetical protein HBH67_212450 [Parastagonospora nodorum]KAH4760331.1 hypothetical protein HBH63_213680 [Parastagonospora nodorum]KAH4770784.1 hypothetical protein HBH62_216280 [Parastagonospora nodorum]